MSSSPPVARAYQDKIRVPFRSRLWHTFSVVLRFLPHAHNPETKVLSYFCWIYFCVFRLPSKEVFDLLYRRLPEKASQNLLQPLWRLLELFLARQLDKMESKEWRYMNVVCNWKKQK